MAPLTRADLRRQSPAAWGWLGLLVGVAGAFWIMGRQGAAIGTLAAVAGCVGLILPPRERMGVLPQRLRRLPRALDVTPALMTLLVSPGYGLRWFYGDNPYDEVVHLLNGVLAGAVLAGWLGTDGRRRGAGRLAWTGAVVGLVLGAGWEAFEWATALIGGTLDTLSDIALTAVGTAGGAGGAALVPWPRGDRAARG